MRALVALAALALLACDATGRGYVSVPLEVRGTASSSFDVGGWQVELTRAEVGLGPMWLCSTESADPEFCESAVLELLDSVSVDALDATPRSAGDLHGLTGTARSVMFDYGISWFPTDSRPAATSGAPEGHSGVFEGRATRGAESFRFRCALDVTPSMQGAVLVRGQRITDHELAPGDRLRIAIDAAAWWRRVDYERLAARAAAGEDPVVLAPGDPDYEALVVSLTAGRLPTLEWSR